MAEAKRFDVWTLGETMVRFTPRGFGRLEDGGEFEVRTGGSESNVAIALARFGLNVAWASRMPRGPLGTLIARRLRGHGVHLDQVIWTDQGRVGLYFIEHGAAPRPTRVIYDRARSAASMMHPEDFDWGCLDDVRHVHLTGITPALSDSCRATTERAALEARERGCTVSFDVNFRAGLWGPAEARLALAPIIAHVDLLVCTELDARLVFQLSGSFQDMLRGLSAMAHSAAVALTLGARGAVVYQGGEYHHGSGFEVTEVEALLDTRSREIQR